MTASAEQRAELIAGGVVLAVAAGFLAWAAGGELLPRGGYELTASFPDVDGVDVGTEVRLAGVRIGRVSAVTLNPQTYMADARLTIPKEVVLPADSAALIQSDGLLGGAYIQIQPGGSLDDLAPGDEIEDVQGAVSLLQLMMKFVDSQSRDGEGGAE
ncbi:outer membrane lipid asymmetry maintenance protein MlaD [Paracoccus siganidrum]|uniref:Outer membrane lipid asymmetry maintenance protein MlaD n=1 Tax=Paracoccus siganidrum TaxID=1276757 RepID=A0A419A909_9RHOB|nr:outer membrane lipid asymmetry maintenance protein MlaD [Paracoccus siganidrum]RJL18537.1 outer membrane lipid asymmetry maintenance protein MlaD [Paracoccus siganidrum]RMC36823.1 outer membrane lipid asymmetry maintenance protein MlaD [Paracoccus siganidrum]